MTSPVIILTMTLDPPPPPGDDTAGEEASPLSEPPYYGSVSATGGLAPLPEADYMKGTV